MIRQREQLLEQNQLDDEGLKQLGDELLNRFLSEFHLGKLREGEFMNDSSRHLILIALRT